MHPDTEINALNEAYETLKLLDNAQIKRILVWVEDKFDLENQPDLKAVEREAPKARAASTPVEASQPAAAPVNKRRGRRPGKAKTAAEPVKKRRGRRPAKVEPVVEEPVALIDETQVIQRFQKYDNFEELLLFSTAKTNIAKILLAGAYLQVEKNFKEFGSYDISSMFKEIGEKIGHPSQALNYLMSKNPPLLIQTGTKGPGLKARRNFRVTEEGLRIAGNYIKE
jgi:hypothetical protein